MALDGPALGKTSYSLVDHGIEDGEGKVLLGSSLVEQGLHITFGKDSTATCYGVGLLCLGCKAVHLVLADM